MNTRNASRLLMTALLFGGVLTAATAQTDKAKEKGQVKVKVMERTDAGEMREFDRTYNVEGMKDDDRDAMVNRIVDSLRTKRGNNRGQITIIVEDDNGSTRIVQRDVNGNRVDLRQRSGDSRAELNGDRSTRRYRVYPDSLADRSRRFEFSFPENWSTRMNDAFRNWSVDLGDSPKASTIRSLQVYPNNPEQHELNVRFTAPAKGDVKIRVTTPDGREIARKDVKDFSGSFTGQIDLGKKAKGVYFVTVTQNEDGAMKRIVLSE
ncbi:T9SS type A sorting domain-containing protein [Tellurirhabdus rosea]|uniref:T9SS type A sorting domain-containing protein n=1 Tax=Tellurirhabdus rosea TaxID=2674997 RepID=UPI002259A153|nr:T9SS type A sorting domain-containing protein [Tellurirhabdus rosea]